MDDATLRADCSRCIGLCCIVLAFDRGESFAFDKPAGTPCQHLRADHRCGIHGELAARGMPGCAAYTCYGAGQLVTELFARHHWADSAATLRLMSETFRRVRDTHRWLSLLSSRTPASPDHAKETGA
jgi:hypothetical protein